jgi:hypothetical protein
MKKASWILIAFFLLNSCGSNKTSEEQTKNVQEQVTNDVPDSKYKITSETPEVVPKFGINKCNINVELSEKISKEELTSIAKKLRKTRMSYDKLWIFYNLPGMTVGTGAWATTHFTPNLEVEILGTTSETEKKMNSVKVDGKMIGKWQDARPYSECLWILYEKNKKIFLKRTFSDGSSGEDEYIKKQFKGKVRYELKQNPEKVYYLLEDNGNLSMWGQNGKFGDALKTD